MNLNISPVLGLWKDEDEKEDMIIIIIFKIISRENYSFISYIKTRVTQQNQDFRSYLVSCSLSVEHQFQVLGLHNLYIQGIYYLSGAPGSQYSLS